jgi:hypothetical protein
MSVDVFLAQWLPAETEFQHPEHRTKLFVSVCPFKFKFFVARQNFVRPTAPLAARNVAKTTFIADYHQYKY